MGTNYFWLMDSVKTPMGKILELDDDNPDIHIGKRSAAGWYCYNCKITLCVQGQSGIHFDSIWYDRCPKCNAEPDLKSKTGVRSTCSFTWAQNKDDVVQFCLKNLDQKIKIGRAHV